MFLFAELIKEIIQSVDIMEAQFLEVNNNVRRKRVCILAS
jgi:hypothetical protein